MTFGDLFAIAALAIVVWDQVTIWRLQNIVREQSRLLSSRSFTDYGVGLKKEAEAKKLKEAEPEEKQGDYSF